jgi:hypothetical protein
MTVMKKIATGLLIVFIVFAIGIKIVPRNVPQEDMAIPDGNHVLLFHAETRCPTCNLMESLINEVLEKQEYIDLGIDLLSLEYNVPANKELVERFRVGTASIILMEQRKGEIVRSNNITSEAWHWIDYRKRFTGMLETRFTEFFRDKIVVSNNTNPTTANPPRQEEGQSP